MKLSIPAKTARAAKAAIARAARGDAGPTRTSANWRSVWIRKGTEPTLKTLTLPDFFKMNGWDTGAGQLDEQTWLKLIGYFRKRLRVRRDDSLLEVGCGAGLFLLPFARKGVRVSGVDYSRTLVEVAKAVLPRNSCVRHSEANRLPFPSGSFDNAASNGVFLYFPSWGYAEEALDEIVRVLKPGGRCLITDLNDISKRTLAERMRRKNLGLEKYRRMYRGLGHRYYRREWFVRYARKRGLVYEVASQKKANSYGNSAWRFMFYFEKPAAALAAA